MVDTKFERKKAGQEQAAELTDITGCALKYSCCPLGVLPAVSSVPSARSTVICLPGMQLGHWVTGSMGHLGHHTM